MKSKLHNYHFYEHIFNVTIVFTNNKYHYFEYFKIYYQYNIVWIFLHLACLLILLVIIYNMMFYKYIEFICDMNHYMHIYMYIHILHFNGHSLSHYLIISSIFKIDFKIDPYLLFFIEEHLDSFLFSLVQIIPQWPLLSTSYFFFSPPSFLLSFLTSFSIYRKKSENCETKRRQIPRIVLQRLYSIRFTIHTWNFLFLLLINTNMVTFQLFLNWWTWRCSYYLLPSVIICCLFLIKIAYPCFFITCTST